ncbi:UDP-N-acetylmuramate dehydrogenase [Candidatus Poriferisodalis sp.]|uniref:UDP-N-acetylmuramate dehydrogenase n=1 Tax=Candidatus Poriferisodalis sp. TaxID=3101277 RepID=UPI003B0134CA
MSPDRWSDPEAVSTAASVLGPRARIDAPLGALTTSRVGGPAAVAFEANSPADLQRVRTARKASGLGVMVIGRGSNLLVADRGFEGIALFLGEAHGEIEIDQTDATVTAGASVALPVLARQCASAGIGGLEWAVGVPGSVGGAVRMNAGGHGSDMASCLLDAGIVDLNGWDAPPRIVSHQVDSLALDYRRSGLTDSDVVLRARLQGQPTSPRVAMDRIAEIVRWRRENQPGGQNAGSVFMNPPSESAGAQIDQAGLRGLRIGSAEVSRVHANFIVSDPGGTAADVVALMEEIRRRVTEHSGVVLQPEVRMVGFEDSPTPA